MFEQLFKRPSTISAHSNAPYAEERRLYLAACAQQGNSRSTLVFDARDLLWVARKLSLYPDLHEVSIEQVRALANAWKTHAPVICRSLTTPFTAQRSVRLAVAWLRFLGHLQGPKEASPF